MIHRYAVRLFVLAIMISLAMPLMAPLATEARAENGKPVRIRIATTPVVSPLVTHEADRPGLMIELFNRVEPMANVKFDYTYVPWDQCLRMVRTGLVHGIFNASFRPERAEYGDYPLKGKTPDETRATYEYRYDIFAGRQSGMTWDGKVISGVGSSLAVPRDASIIPKLKSLGVPYTEVSTYAEMLALVRTRRADGLVGLPETVESLMNASTDADADIQRMSPSLQTSIGYLMFSKRFCGKNGSVCEAVWNAIGEVRRSQEYKDLQATYN
jgi:polar amino acid transport system substrate-binding protein